MSTTRILLFFVGCFIGGTHPSFSQTVGINTESPKSSLHIMPGKIDGTTAEGVIAPNLTRAQLISKDARYTTDQRGAIVYVTSINGTATAKTTNITSIGYYYFDGTIWQRFSETSTEPWQIQSSTNPATSNSQNIFQMGSVAIGSNNSNGNKLHVTGQAYVSNGMNVGGNTSLPTASASLELNAANKAFLPNRVALTSSTDVTTVVSPVKGMVVYNINDEVIGEGFYYWNGSAWRRLMDEVPPTPSNSVSRFYQTSIIPGGAASGDDQDGMVNLLFSQTRAVHNPVDIRLPDDGSYAFNIKLHARIWDLKTNAIAVPNYSGKMVVYIGIWVNGHMQDLCEIFAPISTYAVKPEGWLAAINGTLGQTVTFGCTGKANDLVEIKFGYYQNSIEKEYVVASTGLVSDTPRSDCTTLIFWKL